MPSAPPRPCTHPGCGALVRDGSGRCARHPVREGSFADRRRGTRHERGYGSQWDRIREQVLQRDCGLCQTCQRAGLLTPATQVDHIVNKAQWRRLHGGLAGVDGLTNLQAICVPCHRAKTAQERQAGRPEG